MSDILLKSMHFPRLDARYIVGDDDLSTAGAAADAKATGDALATKADKSNTYTKAQVDDKVGDAKTELEEAIDDLDERKAEIDGCYEGLTSGMAMGLITDSVVEDKEPYNIRSLAHLPVGKFCYDTIVGGSVVWNQQNLNRTSDSYSISGVTFAKQADGSWIANGTATADTTIPLYVETPAYKDHKYFIFGEGSEKSYLYMFTKITGSNRQYALPQILSASNDYVDSYFRPRVVANAEYTNHKIRFGVIDLTAALGPTIADYVYSLETSTAGAGVAWVRKYFPGIYYGYAEPHFEHVQTSEKITIGFNRFDEQTELGIYGVSNNKIVKVTDANRIRCKNFIPVLPNTTYHYNGGGWGAWIAGAVDEEGNGAYELASSDNAEFNFTTGSTTKYIVFHPRSGYGSTYKNDICINIHGDRDGEYEPYRKRTYPIEPKVLRGVPKLDSANRLYFDGDVMRSNGSGEQKYGLVDMGTLTWTFSESYNCFYAFIASSSASPYAPKFDFAAQCTKYPFVGIYANLEDKTCAYIFSDRIAVRDTSYTDAASFKTAMSGVYLLYELNTPQPFTAEPYQSPMVVDPLGTEEFVDYGVEQGDRDAAIPVGHDSNYPEDLVKKTEKMPSPTGTSGDYLITEVDGKLYLKPYVPAVGLTAPTSEGEGE